MKTLNKTLLATLVAVSAFTSTATLAAQSANLAVTTDYVFRGISQSDSGPAFQGGFDWESEQGFFVGTWASTVDFGDDANAEIDFYGGYFGETESFSYDITYNYYTYQGYSSEDDSNYGELLLNAYVGDFKVSFGYANDYINLGESVTYVGVAYDMALPQDYALTLQAGYSMGEDALGENYIDYSATVSKTFNGFDVTAALIGTDISDNDAAETRLVLSVAKTFDL